MSFGENLHRGPDWFSGKVFDSLFRGYSLDPLGLFPWFGFHPSSKVCELVFGSDASFTLLNPFSNDKF